MLNDIQNRNSLLFKKVYKILNTLKIKNGSSHFEFIFTKKNELIPIDCNIRAGGSGISSYYLKNTLNINMLEKDFYSLSNQKVNVRKKKVLVQLYIIQKLISTF